MNSAPIQKMPRGIVGRLLALPDDINLADIDWTPESTVETAAAPCTGNVASPSKHGRAKRQPTRKTHDNKARRPKTHSRSMASDKQQATCPRSGPTRQVSGSEARLDTPRPGGGSIFPAKRSRINRTPSFACAFPVCAANGI